MKILLTGSTGYIGKRLLPVLVEQGHEVVCCVRDLRRFNAPASLLSRITAIEADLLDESTLLQIPDNIDGAFYLVHSMSTSRHYQQLEETCALNFQRAMSQRKLKHVVYLGGIVNENHLSSHLASRKNVEEILQAGAYNFTALRAGIIIGSGSASFEIIRDLVEKLPLMITPRWLKTRCQPIGVVDVIKFLSLTIFHAETYNGSYDIGGPDILTYKEMLLGFAKARKLRRVIWIVPVMTPRLSSYWLYFVTSTSYKLAITLVDSMKVEVVCKNDDLAKILGIVPMNYAQALSRAFSKIKSSEIVSSWKDAYVSSDLTMNISEFIEVPTFGCFTDKRSLRLVDRAATIKKIWRIGGENGWYYGNWLWRVRGFLDKLVGGVGLRRGRTNPEKIFAGDTLDFWRVLYANKEEGRLLLFAEMKLSGEAWLEFLVFDNTIFQTATFRPLGLWGRIYWYAVLPFHGLIFNGMLRKIRS